MPPYEVEIAPDLQEQIHDVLADLKIDPVVIVSKWIANILY